MQYIKPGGGFENCPTVIHHPRPQQARRIKVSRYGGVKFFKIPYRSTAIRDADTPTGRKIGKPVPNILYQLPGNSKRLIDRELLLLPSENRRAMIYNQTLLNTLMKQQSQFTQSITGNAQASAPISVS